jgi:hypothetical protein
MMRRTVRVIGGLIAITFSSAALLAQTDPGKPMAAKPDQQGWIRLFDGKTLSGWTAPNPGRWSVTPDGVLTGEGPVSHLFSPGTYTNFEFKSDAKLNHSGNSGMYFRAELDKGWPKGYESQVENSSPDPQKTGSLYNFSKVTEQLVPDDTWWTQHIIAIGNRIVILVNGKVVTDYVDTANTYKTGHLALQQHNEGSVVMYRNSMVKPLPDDEQAAWKIVLKAMPELANKK